MKRVAVINQKGGVGKTTTTVNHGAALARLGHRILLLDLDPQANLTLHIDRRPEPDTKTLTDLLVDGASFPDMIQPTSTPDLFVVPADTSLAGVEHILANRIGRETILREAFATIEDRGFDFVFIDCPPSLGVLSANALVAADEVLIPIQTEYFALQGMAKLVEVIELVQRSLNPDLHIKAVLPCMVDHRTRLSSEVQDEIRRHFGKLLAQTVIRMNVKLAEAPSFGLTIFEHAPESNGAQDHDHFAREYLGWKIPVEGEEELEELEEEEVETAEVTPETDGDDELEGKEAETEAHAATVTEEAVELEELEAVEEEVETKVLAGATEAATLTEEGVELEELKELEADEEEVATEVLAEAAEAPLEPDNEAAPVQPAAAIGYTAPVIPPLPVPAPAATSVNAAASTPAATSGNTAAPGPAAAPEPPPPPLQSAGEE